MTIKNFLQINYSDAEHFSKRELLIIFDAYEKHKKQLNKKKKENIMSKMAAVYSNSYLNLEINKQKIPPIFQAKEWKALKELIKSIEYIFINKGKDPSEDDIVNTFNIILQNITDEWILKNFTLIIINSQWNKIILNVSQKSFERTSIKDQFITEINNIQNK